MGSLTNPTLPTIEFPGKNLVPGSPSWLSTSQSVVSALEQHGCFIANYLNFSPQMHETIVRASEELFRLPIHVKALNTSDTPSHGYVGQEPVIPLYEGLGIENATTPQGVKGFTDLLWPPGNDHFSEAALEFSRVVAELDQVVMKMVSERYGIESSYNSLLGATSYLLRLIKYIAPGKEDGEVGIIPHTDKSFMSILHQHQVNGLEIRTKDGEWITIEASSPSSFLVMAGDACMGWSNGRIEPSYHRVTMRGDKERYAWGVFTFIRDMKVEVPAELVDVEHPLQFKPFDHYKYIHFYYTEEGRRAKCPLRAYCGV